MRSLSRCLRAAIAPSLALRSVAHSPGRPPSVLAALLRLRQQQQQQRGPGPAAERGPAPGLGQEASRLLRKEARGAEPLSDVDVASVAFCVEVGKLLSVAAAFGASTTAPRVADALVWVRAHASRLSHPRQIMSIAMPLLNLRDGRVAGKAFVMEVLIDPLVTALEKSNRADSSEQQLQENQRPERGLQQVPDAQQQRAAIVSVFQLVVRLLEPNETVPPQSQAETALSSNDTARLCELLTVAASALQRTAPHVVPLSDAAECANVLRACACLYTCGETSVASELLSKLLPLLEAALPSVKKARVADVSQLLLAVAQIASVGDIPAVERIARGALVLLPPALAAATAKEMCAASQALTRIRASPVAGAVDAAAMRRFVDAMRPKLFRLAETNAAQLRHVECSLLLANLTRLNAPLDDDFINLLCSAFANFVTEAQPAHMVPFFGGILRSRPQRGLETGEPSLWESPRMPALRRCLDTAAERAVALTAAGTLGVAEAAQVLTVMAQLRGPQCGAVYLAVEPMMEAAVGDIKAKVLVTELGKEKGNTGDGETMKNSEEVDVPRGDGVGNYVSLLSTLMHALDAFRSESLTASSDDDVVLQRAAALQAELRHCAALGVLNAQQPKELVVLMRLLAEEDSPGADMETPSQQQSLSDTGGESSQLDAVGQRVVELAPLANAYEVGALARVTTSLCARGLMQHTAAVSALEALARRGVSVELSLHDAHALIESLRRAAPEVEVNGELISRFAAILRATPERTVYLLRPLLSLLRRAPAGSLPTAVTELSIAAMSSTCALLAERSEPPPLRDLALLAHILAQLDAITREKDIAGRDADHENDNDRDAEGEGVNDQDAEAEQVNETERDVVNESADPSGGSALAVATRAAFAAIGDAASLSLQQQQQRSSAALAPRELVMLLQAFEQSGPRGAALPYDLLPVARDMAPELGPLELSLLLNGFARLGVWNGRVLSGLARGAAARVPSCGLRHCHAILQALHSAQCLRRGACADQTHPSSSPAPPEPAPGTMEDSLRALTAAVVERMAELVNTSDAVRALLEAHDANEIAGAARALTFFDPPPQPALDTYIALAVRRATTEEPSGHTRHAPNTQNSRLFAAGAVAPLIVHLRREDYRRVSARAIAALIDGTSSNSSGGSSSSHAMKQEHYKQLLLLPAERIAALYHWRCTFAVLYGVDFAPAAAAPLLAAVAERLRNDELTAQHRVVAAARDLTRFACAPVGDATAASRVVADTARRVLENAELRPATAAALLDALMDSDSPERESEELFARLLRVALSGDPSLLSLSAATAVLATSASLSANDAALDAGLAAAQRTVLMHERRLYVRPAVSLLLAAAKTGGTLSPEVACGAARRMAVCMGRTDRTGMRLLPELHRLVTARGGVFVASAARLEPAGSGGVREVCERVPAVLLRAKREAQRNVGASLCAKCRAGVVRAYEGTGWDGVAGLAEILEELAEK